MGDRTYVLDVNAGLSDGALAYTASGYAQYGGAVAALDMGGNQNISITLPAIAATPTLVPQQARIDAVCVIDLTNIKTSSGNELYRLIMVGSNNLGFTATQELGMIEFGASPSGPAGMLPTPQPAAVGGSRYELLFSTEQNSQKYQFLALYNNISGSTPSINYRAFVAVLPEP